MRSSGTSRPSGARHVISAASGTDALLLVLIAKGIGRGDAVFCPTFTFCATAEMVALLGAAVLALAQGPVVDLFRGSPHQHVLVLGVLATLGAAVYGGPLLLAFGPRWFGILRRRRAAPPGGG